MSKYFFPTWRITQNPEWVHFQLSLEGGDDNSNSNNNNDIHSLCSYDFFFFERKRQTHERHTNQACCVCDRVLANAEKRPGVLDPHRWRFKGWLSYKISVFIWMIYLTSVTLHILIYRTEMLITQTRQSYFFLSPQLFTNWVNVGNFFIISFFKCKIRFILFT